MWRVVRILKLNRAALALSLIKLDAVATKGNLNDDFYITGQLERHYNNGAVVKRRAVLNNYIWKYHKEFCEGEKGLTGFKDDTSKEFQRILIEVQDLIQSCITYDFINPEPNDPSRISLTGKGKMFASIDGLLKEEITNGLGILWSVIGTGTTVLAAIKIQWIIDFASRFSLWW